MQKNPCVYILASKKNGTVYVGVTTNLIRRVWLHRQKLIRGFTEKYNVTRLVWFEFHPAIEYALTREKQIKEWRRKWKIQLIEKTNSEWADLFDEISN